jgi:hypothetical protein
MERGYAELQVEDGGDDDVEVSFRHVIQTAALSAVLSKQ